MAKTSYNADSIQVLDYPENIQRRPGMYVGGKGQTALHHLAIEAIDNAVDEAMAGDCDQITVTIHRDDSITIADNGRGFPVGIHPEKGKSALEIALTELHAGGKFEEGSYSTSGGLHGVGIKATNALSDWLEVEVKRNGVIYHQRYENGLPVTSVQILDPHNREVIGEVGVRGSKTAIRKHHDNDIDTGSKITFKPSVTHLSVTEFGFEALARRLQVVSFLVPGFDVRIQDNREGIERTFHHEGGLVEYVEYLNRNRKPLHDPMVIEGKNDDANLRLEVVLQYHDQVDEELISFVNTIPTPDGGRHVSGFRAALTRAINQFAEDKRMFKRGDKITGRDTIAGLAVVVSLKIPEPQFTSQTKTQLGNEPVHGQVHSIVYDALLKRFRKNVSMGRSIVKRCLAASRARRAAKKARSLVVRKSVLEVDELPGKLADIAKGSPPEQTTLFIVEGDSAGGSCKQARNRNYHAILPLRGKIPNVERRRLSRSLNNKEIKAIVAAVGAGVKADFALDAMRYERVAILVDADFDGDHIKALLYTLFWRLMRPMVEAGRLYVARAPLYLLTQGRKKQYIYTDSELAQVREELNGHYSLQRYKGLGEMNPEQLRKTVFRTDGPIPWMNQNLIRVSVNDQPAANETIGLWMGSSARKRRARLMTHWNGTSPILDENGG